MSQLSSVTYAKTRRGTHLKERIDNECNVVLPSGILQPNWVDERRKETGGMHDTRHICNSAGSHLVGKKLGRIGPERSPSKVISAVAKEDGDDNTNRVVPCAVFGIYCINCISTL